MPSRGKLEPRSSTAALAGAEPFAAVVEAPAPASLVLVASLSLVDAGTRLAPRRERVRLIAASLAVLGGANLNVVTLTSKVQWSVGRRTTRRTTQGDGRTWLRAGDGPLAWRNTWERCSVKSHPQHHARSQPHCALARLQFTNRVVNPSRSQHATTPACRLFHALPAQAVLAAPQPKLRRVRVLCACQ